MSLSYRAIDWNRQKKWYDLVLAGLLVAGLGVFCAVSALISPNITAETLIIRSTAIAAIGLLHVILAIGPLARLDSRFLPLLYNRRHLGVVMFLLASIHASVSVFQFHALGDENPFISVFTAYRRDYRLLDAAQVNIGHFPFEPFGAMAWGVLFLMAATSHDFWLKNLGASVWKTLHFGVYLAYGCLLAHLALGIVQTERAVIYPAVIGAGFVTLVALHITAGRKEATLDNADFDGQQAEFMDVCPVESVREGRGHVVVVGHRRVALFRHQGKIFATSNVCRHQGGPVGEGRIVDGCITCPWHGWNYRPDDGCSPPPFKEVLETYDTRAVNGRVWVRKKQNAPGTRCAGSPAIEGAGRPAGP